MRRGRHVDRSVLTWPACVSLALDCELSREPPPILFFLCVVSQGLAELGRAQHTWVCVVHVQLGRSNGCERGGCLREKSTGVKNCTLSGLF